MIRRYYAPSSLDINFTARLLWPSAEFCRLHNRIQEVIPVCCAMTSGTHLVQECIDFKYPRQFFLCHILNICKVSQHLSEGCSLNLVVYILPVLNSCKQQDTTSEVAQRILNSIICLPKRSKQYYSVWWWYFEYRYTRYIPWKVHTDYYFNTSEVTLNKLGKSTGS